MQVADLEQRGHSGSPTYASCTLAFAMIACGVSQRAAAVVHDGDPVGEAGDDLDVVLDHQHRLAAPRRGRSGSARRARGRSRPRRPPSARRAGSPADRPRAPSRARAGACRRARASPPPGPDAAASPTRSSAQSARSTASLHAERAPPEAQRPAEPRLARRAARSPARSAAGTRSRPGRCARARAASAGTAAAGDVLAVERGSAPAVGRRRPESRLKSDVFPAPFGPITPTNSPARDLERDIGDDGRAADVEPEAVGARGSEMRSRSRDRPSGAVTVAGRS